MDSNQYKDERTLEEVYRSAVAGLYARIRSYYDYLYRSMGDRGLALIADMSREYGLSIVERARRRLGDNSIDSVADYLIRIFNTVGRNSDYQPVVEQSCDRVVIRIARCPLNFDKPEMCQAHTTMERTVVEGLNPDLVYYIGKSIPAGDSVCEHVIEIKKTG